MSGEGRGGEARGNGRGQGGGQGNGGGGGRGNGHGGPGQGRNRGGRSGQKDTVLYPAAPGLAADAAYALVCVDDTDDLSGTTSTGQVAEAIAVQVAALGGRVVLGVTRHQLLLAPGVPYTSHNSAMCFAARLPRGRVAELRERAVAALGRLAVPASDPGLCVAVLDEATPSAQVAALVAYGRRAQCEVVAKREAYELAAALPWVELSEHGGDGQGVVGALAGVGLRLSGEDGRFRGKWDLAELAGVLPGRLLAAADLAARLEPLVGGPVAVVGTDGEPLDPQTPVLPVEAAKPVLHGGALALVAELRDGVAVPCEKVDLGTAGNRVGWDSVCERYEPDNDVEECGVDLRRSCRDCLWRRWTDRGFTCVVPPAGA